MFCESCGKNIPDESKFCEHCGSEVIPEIDIHSEEDTDNGAYYEQERELNYTRENRPHYEQENEPYHKKDIKKEYEYDKTPIPKKSGLIKKASIFLVLAVVLIGGYSIISQFIGKNPEKKPEKTFEQANNQSMGSEGVPQKEQPSSNTSGNNTSGNDVPENNTHIDNSSTANNSVIINEDDFNWHFEEYYYELPKGAVELSYMDILGEWKLMAVNYVPDTEEIHFSTAVISEYSPDEAHMGANTSVFFKHQYTKFDGEKYYYDEEDLSDMVLCSYGEGILQMALADDKVMDVIFWEKEGKQYGQSYLFRDDDNDGFADLIFSMAFVR